MKPDKIIAVRNNKTVYKDGDSCLKVFSRDFSKTDILNEALNQARVEETGLNIPKIKSVTVIDGKWTIVSDYIRGKTLSRLMLEYPEKTDGYIKQLVDIQSEMHNKSCPMLSRLRDKTIERLGLARLDPFVLKRLCALLDEIPEADNLCHGDFSPSNIVISDNGAYILDWSHASRGNKALDTAVSYLLLYLDNTSDDAEVYLQMFCEKNGIDAGYIKKLLPVAAAAQLSKSNEKEREFFNSWIK